MTVLAKRELGELRLEPEALTAQAQLGRAFMAAGNAAFAARNDEGEISTFYLTDFLVRQFDAFVTRPLGLDRHPELRDSYFGHYEKLVYQAQTDDPALTEKARACAQRLGLAFEVEPAHVDEEARQKALKRLEADLEEQQAQLEAVAQEGVEALKQRLVEEEARIEEQKEAVRGRLDEELASATEQVMKEAVSSLLYTYTACEFEG